MNTCLHPIPMKGGAWMSTQLVTTKHLLKKESVGKTLIKNIKKHPVLYIMALPVFLYFVIFHFFPMYGLIISFQRYIPAKGLFGSPWVGLKYFTDFFKDMFFWRLIRNTFTLSFLDLVFGFPVPIIFALLLNELTSSKFKKITQTITYMPHFISLVVVCGLIFTFTRSTGPIAQIVASWTGTDITNLLGQSQNFRTIFVSTNIWQGFGWGSIIYFAALSGIDPSLYEAAVIDGAKRMKQVIYITLPGIAPTIIILLILRLGQIMSVGFEKIILLYSPATYETADVISSYVYRKGLLELNFSFGTAVGLFNSVINFALILMANTVSRRVNQTSLW